MKNIIILLISLASVYSINAQSVIKKLPEYECTLFTGEFSENGSLRMMANVSMDCKTHKPDYSQITVNDTIGAIRSLFKERQEAYDEIERLKAICIKQKNEIKTIIEALEPKIKKTK